MPLYVVEIRFDEHSELWVEAEDLKEAEEAAKEAVLERLYEGITLSVGLLDDPGLEGTSVEWRPIENISGGQN